MQMFIDIQIHLLSGVRQKSDEIVTLLRKSNREYDQTIVMITHNMDIAACADRIIRMEDGKVVG